MSVYVLMEARIKDAQKHGQYLKSLSEIVAKFKGRWLAYDSAVTPLPAGMKEERRQPQRVFLLEFPSMVQVRRCFTCPEHQSITGLNSEGADTRAIILHGICPADAL
jgi:uncharacterized protein (DUF1330 family)